MESHLSQRRRSFAVSQIPMRFRLKTLFVVIGIAAIASVYLVVFTERWRERERVSSQLRASGANAFEFNNRNYLSYVSFTENVAGPGLPEFVRIDRLDLTGRAGSELNLNHVRNANIWHLMLDSTNASDDSMQELRHVDQLRILDIANTQVTDSAIQSIASIQGLEGANLTGTKITLAGAQELKRLRPEIWLVHESIDVAWDGGELPEDSKQQ